jgi:hypothetical protein
VRATVAIDLLVPRGTLGSLAQALRARGYVVAHSADMLRVYPAGADPDRSQSAMCESGVHGSSSDEHG